MLITGMQGGGGWGDHVGAQYSNAARVANEPRANAIRRDRAGADAGADDQWSALGCRSVAHAPKKFPKSETKQPARRPSDDSCGYDAELWIDAKADDHFGDLA